MKRDWPVVSKGGEELPWAPLKLKISLANTPEQVDSNIEASLKRQYIPFSSLIDKEQGAVAIVGSGPSLKQTWKQLKRFKGDIIACNASNQFLLERGIIPKYVMIFDADILAEEFVTTPHKDITYLIASRCHPKVFEHLEGYKIVVWHAKGDLNLEKILEERNRMEPMCGGGGAAVTRTMFLAQPMGYRTLHLYGVDSSFDHDKEYEGEIDYSEIKQGQDHTHIRKSTTEEKFLPILCNGRVFHTTPWMASQAEDFKVLVPSLQQIGVKIVVHGTGLIPHLAKAMHLDVDGEPKVKQVWREAKNKARTLWHHL